MRYKQDMVQDLKDTAFKLGKIINLLDLKVDIEGLSQHAEILEHLLCFLRDMTEKDIITYNRNKLENLKCTNERGVE